MATAELLVNILKGKFSYLGLPLGRCVGVLAGIIQMIRRKEITDLIY